MIWDRYQMVGTLIYAVGSIRQAWDRWVEWDISGMGRRHSVSHSVSLGHIIWDQKTSIMYHPCLVYLCGDDSALGRIRAVGVEVVNIPSVEGVKNDSHKEWLSCLIKERLKRRHDLISTMYRSPPPNTSPIIPAVMPLSSCVSYHQKHLRDMNRSVTKIHQDAGDLGAVVDLAHGSHGELISS